jgi:hypothetical protein
MACNACSIKPFEKKYSILFSINNMITSKRKQNSIFTNDMFLKCIFYKTFEKKICSVLFNINDMSFELNSCISNQKNFLKHTKVLTGLVFESGRV